MKMDRRGIVSVAVSAINKFLFETILAINDSESDNSSDEEMEMVEVQINQLRNNLNPRKRLVPRIENYFENTVPRYTVDDFRSHFRMTRATFEILVGITMPLLNADKTTGRPKKNLEKQLLAVIWLIATPDSYRSVGDRFNLGKASVADAFIRVIRVLNQLAPSIIKWPTVEQARINQEKFQNYGGMEHVVGAIDGTYVPIKAPRIDPEIYVTRKSTYAMTLQAVAEPSLKFIDAFIAYPGSVSDARIFRNSTLYELVERNPNTYFQNTFILGDKAYPLLTWCIPPYVERGRLEPHQNYFNIIHAKTRQVVERSFALLFGRFRRLKYLDMNRTDLIPPTVLACCVLHNICIDQNDLLGEYLREGDEFLQDNHHDQDAEAPRFPHEIQANNFRENIATNLFNMRL